jgi:hypothetical protein
MDLVSIANLAALLSALAALVAALVPIYLREKKKNKGDDNQDSWFSGPRGWAHYAVWASGVGVALAFAIIIYGLAAPYPVMTSASVLSFRMIAGALGLAGVIAGLGGAVNARQSPHESAAIFTISGAGALAGLAVMGGMFVIV